MTQQRRRPIREQAVRLLSGRHVNIQWRDGEFDSLDEVLEQLLETKLRERRSPWRTSPTPEAW